MLICTAKTQSPQPRRKVSGTLLRRPLRQLLPAVALAVGPRGERGHRCAAATRVHVLQQAVLQNPQDLGPGQWMVHGDGVDDVDGDG